MATHYPNDEEIARLGEGLIGCGLTEPEWTHAAHFAATLWILRHRPDILPERDMPGLIRTFNLSLGGKNTDSAGYHETITQASLRGARAHIESQPADLPLHLLLDRLMETHLGQSGWLLSYWTREQLFSAGARRNWLEPDLAPLPW